MAKMLANERNRVPPSLAEKRAEHRERARKGCMEHKILSLILAKMVKPMDMGFILDFLIM